MKTWGKAEIEFIRLHYTVYIDSEIAKILGRTKKSVKLKRERLGGLKKSMGRPKKRKVRKSLPVLTEFIPNWKKT